VGAVVIFLVNQTAFLWPELPRAAHGHGPIEVVHMDDVCLLLEAWPPRREYIRVFASRHQRAGWLRTSAGRVVP